ncbi:hypothetical protein GGI12_001936 [Dipsacomyces acuminosporus]|nr:hypothetical protein GGI12_001936 [Dipsacomyces acuminosporus]
MHINDLGCDILSRVFSVVRKEHSPRTGCPWRKQLVGVSAVCHTWRALLLPYVHRHVYIAHCGYDIDSNIPCYGDDIHSNAVLLQSYKCVAYARELEIDFEDDFFTFAYFMHNLKEAGIAQTIWPNITTLKIYGRFLRHEPIDDSNKDSVGLVVKEIADIFSMHMPRIIEIECIQTIEAEQWHVNSEHPCLLIPELASRYSAQLRKLHLGIYCGYLANGLSIPRLLTHLDIDMGGYERRVLPRVFAASLQFLRIDNASPDITWNWFNNGGNDDDEHIWFSSLSSLAIEFDTYSSSQTGYRPNPTSIGTAAFQSDYRHAAKRVHFPVLSKLKVGFYPFMDGSFYQLFKGCKLKNIDIELPLKAHYTIPAQILARLARMNVTINYNKLQLQRENGSQGESSLEKLAYGRGISNLMALKSTVQSARVKLCYFETISLPTTVAWSSVQRLELDCFVDVESIHVLLASMPRLRHLGLYMRASYLNATSIGSVTTATTRQAERQIRIVNKRVEYLELKIFDEMTKRGLLHLLSDILPLVPSLLRLVVNRGLVHDARSIVLDPANSLEWMSQQLEVSPW